MKNKLSQYLFAGATIVALGAGVAGIASAQTAVTSATSAATTVTATPATSTVTNATGTVSAQPQGHAPIGTDGNVTAITGTTITMQEESDEGGASYTVNAGSATVTKDGAASTLSSITVGDKIFITGTVSGTMVTATSISSGHGGRGHVDDSATDGIPEASEVHTGATTQ